MSLASILLSGESRFGCAPVTNRPYTYRAGWDDVRNSINGMIVKIGISRDRSVKIRLPGLYWRLLSLCVATRHHPGKNATLQSYCEAVLIITNYDHSVAQVKTHMPKHCPKQYQILRAIGKTHTKEPRRIQL